MDNGLILLADHSTFMDRKICILGVLVKLMIFGSNKIPYIWQYIVPTQAWGDEQNDIPLSFCAYRSE
jgi:hypothetical protein